MTYVKKKKKKWKDYQDLNRIIYILTCYMTKLQGECSEYVQAHYSDSYITFYFYKVLF